VSDYAICQSGLTSAPPLPQAVPVIQIGQANVVVPLIRADARRMTAPIVGAPDQDIAHAAVAHITERDLLLAGH